MPLNIPNIITLIRLLIIPVMVMFYYIPANKSNEIVTALFVLAGITDWLDGYLARKLDQASPFGAFLDPVADKLIVGVALILLVGDSQIAESVLSIKLFTIVTCVSLAVKLPFLHCVNGWHQQAIEVALPLVFWAKLRLPPR